MKFLKEGLEKSDIFISKHRKRVYEMFFATAIAMGFDISLTMKNSQNINLTFLINIIIIYNIKFK